MDHSTYRMTGTRAAGMVALGLVLAFAACKRKPHPLPDEVITDQKAGFVDQDQAGDFTIAVECPPNGEGTGRLHVWQRAVKSAFRADATRLDVSILKGGFASGEYVTITPIDPTAKAMLHDTATKTGNPRTELLSALRMDAQPSYTKESSTADWTVEGLMPGVNYYVRLSSRSDGSAWKAVQVVRVQGPICPMDEREEKP